VTAILQVNQPLNPWKMFSSKPLHYNYSYS